VNVDAPRAVALKVFYKRGILNFKEAVSALVPLLYDTLRLACFDLVVRGIQNSKFKQVYSVRFSEILNGRLISAVLY